jgi:hypothetical protein
VEKEITATLEVHQDPLDAAADAIVASQEDYIKRSDAQKRKKVLEELYALQSSCPLPDEDELVSAEPTK